MSFPCKYEGVICIRCHQEIAIGSMIQFARKDSKDKEHETCPRASPPEAPSVRHGWVPGVSTPSPVDARRGQVTRTQLTYHHRMFTGPEEGDYIDWGESLTIEGPVSNMDRDYLVGTVEKWLSDEFRRHLSVGLNTMLTEVERH